MLGGGMQGCGAWPLTCGTPPCALQVLLRARGLGALAGSDSEGEEGSEGSEGSGGEGGRRRRLHAGDCVVM